MVDVGCGIGGSSRHIARKFGCTAKGITLSPVQVGVNLTWLVGHTESPLAEACLLAIVGSCCPQLAVQPVLLPGLLSPYAALPGRCSDLRIAWVKAGIKQHCHGCTVWPTGSAKSWPLQSRAAPFWLHLTESSCACAGGGHCHLPLLLPSAACSLGTRHAGRAVRASHLTDSTAWEHALLWAAWTMARISPCRAETHVIKGVCRLLGQLAGPGPQKLGKPHVTLTSSCQSMSPGCLRATRWLGRRGWASHL